MATMEYLRMPKKTSAGILNVSDLHAVYEHCQNQGHIHVHVAAR